MSQSNGNIASGALLVIVGVWLLLQTIGGDLPRRLLTLTGVARSGKGDAGLLDMLGSPLHGLGNDPGSIGDVRDLVR